jgi:glycosyltransferase involved in cell wall biosynthesis
MGMPPLEAMSFGKPVFVFPNSSIPEFCKDYAYYWNSENPQYMAEFFLQNIQNIRKQADFEKIRIDYAKQFYWHNTVQNYLNLYRKILNHD